MKLEKGYKKTRYKMGSNEDKKKVLCQKRNKIYFFEVVFLKGHNLRNKWIYLAFLYDLRLQINRNISFTIERHEKT